MNETPLSGTIPHVFGYEWIPKTHEHVEFCKKHVNEIVDSKLAHGLIVTKRKKNNVRITVEEERERIMEMVIE